jgi:hypothetical protein
MKIEELDGMYAVLVSLMSEEEVRNMMQSSEGTHGYGPLVGRRAIVHDPGDYRDGMTVTVTHDWHPLGENAISVSEDPGVELPGSYDDGEYELVEE